MKKKEAIFSARQIAEAIDEDFYSVCKALSRLLHWKEIQFVELDRVQACEILGEKYVTRRMRFYFSIEFPSQKILQDLGL